jgi:cytochrome c553
MAVASLVAVGVIGGWTCSPRRKVSSEPLNAAPVAATAPMATPSVPAKPVVADAAFETKVRPILATSCAPCHNPGGKMYDRMPFDDAKIVRSHADGIRKRLKGDNLQALEAWLAGS